MSSDLKLSAQCVAAANKGMSALRQATRTFKHINIDSLKILYKTYIRPNLISAWCPYMSKYIDFSNSSISITGSPETNFNSPNSFAVLSDLTGKDDVFLHLHWPLFLTFLSLALPLVTLPHFQILDIQCI